MPEVTVLFNTKIVPVKEKIQRELLWHDGLTGELLTFHGGQLGFEYREDEYLVGMGEEDRRRRGFSTTFRMMPKVEDLEVVNYNKTKTVTNEKEVRKWFDNYVNYNVTGVSLWGLNRVGLIINVPDKEMDDFLYQAERQSLRTTY